MLGPHTGIYIFNRWLCICMVVGGGVAILLDGWIGSVRLVYVCREGGSVKLHVPEEGKPKV